MINLNLMSFISNFLIFFVVNQMLQQKSSKLVVFREVFFGSFPEETTVLNHRRFCNWTDRSAEVLSTQLVRDVYRAAVAVERLGSKQGAVVQHTLLLFFLVAPKLEGFFMDFFLASKSRKGSSKAYKLLERLSEPLAELQCCSLQGKSHEVRLTFWLNCFSVMLKQVFSTFPHKRDLSPKTRSIPKRFISRSVPEHPPSNNFPASIFFPNINLPICSKLPSFFLKVVFKHQTTRFRPFFGVSWVPGLNAATLLASLAPQRLGLTSRPSDAGSWAQVLQTAQLEVQGELVSLIEMEQASCAFSLEPIQFLLEEKNESLTIYRPI